MVRNGSSDVTLRGIEVAWVSGWGVTVESGTTGVTVLGCHVHDVGSGAVQMGLEGVPPRPAHNAPRMSQAVSGRALLAALERWAW